MVENNSFHNFSQRHGLEPLPEPMRLEFLSDDLRRELCDVVYKLLNRREYFPFVGDDTQFFVRVLGRFLKLTEDEVNESSFDAYKNFKFVLLNDTFNGVLDLIELIVNDTRLDYSFAENIQQLFEQHLVAYYLDLSRQPYMFYPRCNKEQGTATIKAINTIQENGMDASASHLQEAAKHINTQKYGDSIFHSISAVESVARSIDIKASSLGQALKNLENQGLQIHPALKKGFEKLYGYTCDEQGIRHALINIASPNVGLDEAIFMFGACASFAAYLVSKHQELNSGR